MWLLAILCLPGWIPGLITGLIHCELHKYRDGSNVVMKISADFAIIAMHIIGWAIALYGFGITYLLIS